VEAIGDEPPKLPVIAQVINTCDTPSLTLPDDLPDVAFFSEQFSGK
jgi:hypothetical protein